MAVTSSVPMNSGRLNSLGEFDVTLSVGEHSSFRECMGADRLVDLQRALKDEVGETVFEKNSLESRLQEVSSGSSAEAALAIEGWLAWILGRDLLRKTVSVRAFVDGGADEEVSVASFLLMGVEALPATIAKGERLVAKQPVRKGETVAWSWTTDAWQTMSFRAEFFTATAADDEQQQLAFPLTGLALPLNGNRVVVEQDQENKSWSAETHGTLYLVWENVSSPRTKHAARSPSRSRSLMPPMTTTTDGVVDVALKIAKCDSAAAAAARTAAEEARQHRSTFSLGKVLKAAPAEACGVKVVPVRPSVVVSTDDEETLTGLHVRANLRKAVHRLGGGANSDDHKASPEESLRDALKQVAALEDLAASERARADRGAVATEMERDRAEQELKAARVERENLTAALQAATDRAARAEARVASAVGALNALSEHELRDDDDDDDGDEGGNEDDRAAYNPFVSVDPRADRAWASTLCGHDDIDTAAAKARRAAIRCASVSSRLKASNEQLKTDNKKLTEEKRVLIAELRRLRTVADEKVAESKADADEARMVQRQVAALAKKLKEERKVLARRLTNCTCGAAQGDLVDDPPPPKHRQQNLREQQQEEETRPPPRGGGEDRTIDSRRAMLEAKLQGCLERQSALEAILTQQPDDPKIRTLKSKLDMAIAKLERQLEALRDEDDVSSSTSARTEDVPTRTSPRKKNEADGSSGSNNNHQHNKTRVLV